METKKMITVEAVVNVPVQKLWKAWTSPDDITQWNNASEDWHTPFATNDLREGGRFLSRMESKDGSMGFDFSGIYQKINENELIEYTIDDGRKVKVVFTGQGNKTKITEIFEAEDQNSQEMQRAGWQAILDNFKKYAESK